MESCCQKCKKSMCISIKAENHETHLLISLENIIFNARALDQKEASDL